MAFSCNSSFLNDFVGKLLLALAQDHIEGVASAAVELAQHRSSDTVEIQDLQLCLGKCAPGIRPLAWAVICRFWRSLILVQGVRMRIDSYKYLL